MEKDRCSSRQLVLPFNEFLEAANGVLAIPHLSEDTKDCLEDVIVAHWWRHFAAGSGVGRKTSEEFSSGSHS